MDGPGDYHIKRSKSDRERQILHAIVYMQNLKNDMNKHLQKEIDSQTQRKNYGYQVGREEVHKLGVWDWHVYTAIFKIDNLKGSTIKHSELYSVLCNK